MTYQEYKAQLSKYEHAISRRRSLQMTIQMNQVWLLNKNSKRGKARIVKIEAAQKELSSLVIPPKPQQPIGYQIMCNGDFEGFVDSDDIEYAKEQAIEYLGHDNFELIAKPRFRD